MKTTITELAMSVQSIFDELLLLESLTVLLQNYCLNSTFDISFLTEKQKKAIAFERGNCINITEMVLSGIEKIKNTGETMERDVFLLNQYTNNSRR